jgi:hypothetical protein
VLRSMAAPKLHGLDDCDGIPLSVHENAPRRARRSSPLKHIDPAILIVYSRFVLREGGSRPWTNEDFSLSKGATLPPDKDRGDFKKAPDAAEDYSRLT